MFWFLCAFVYESEYKYEYEIRKQNTQEEEKHYVIEKNTNTRKDSYVKEYYCDIHE